jgi:predicted MFS family arabinose efflux permease
MSLFTFFAVAPTFRDELGITDFETSLLLTVAGAMVLALSVPFGFLADRLGRHRVAIAAAGFVTASAVWHALATDYWSLMAARAVAGVGFAGMLTAGIAWTASSVPPERRAKALGGVIPAAAVAALVGPLLGGQLTNLGGTELAYVVLALLSGLALAWVAICPAGDTTRHPQPSRRELSRILRSAVVLTALALMLLAVLVDQMVSLLVPLQLDENGLSAGTIGAILAAGGVLWVLFALTSVRFAERIVNLRGAGLVTLAIALPLIPLALSTSTAMQATGAISRGIVLGISFTIAFPLGALGAEAMGVGLATANGALMISSGLAMTLGPIGSERVADAIGQTWTYGGLAICAAVAGTLMLVASRSQRGDIASVAAAHRPRTT